MSLVDAFDSLYKNYSSIFKDTKQEKHAKNNELCRKIITFGESPLSKDDKKEKRNAHFKVLNIQDAIRETDCFNYVNNNVLYKRTMMEVPSVLSEGKWYENPLHDPNAPFGNMSVCIVDYDRDAEEGYETSPVAPILTYLFLGVKKLSIDVDGTTNKDEADLHHTKGNYYERMLCVNSWARTKDGIYDLDAFMDRLMNDASEEELTTQDVKVESSFESPTKQAAGPSGGVPEVSRSAGFKQEPPDDEDIIPVIISGRADGQDETMEETGGNAQETGRTERLAGMKRPAAEVIEKDDVYCVDTENDLF